ncbi:FAD-dependent thymidylate synthase [Helicobacter bilis]|uniref:FAD-dependent thymidylate synthase n=1 Tax=Helicobacter bilis TaxID=37372 RepID=UPI0026F206F5|nr:FAD-dependent thymidylate synthase [Helicobacter bilis]MCI7410423.1 FAD-dependent thymidylate synthase [Helicobacter bilis]MDD7296863.1 FAD-dependent thymidylate synthase [Helicobacter bilis]MDY4399772.1 FAD-dependent thymidylate synthase [Helicobacter bilis]
MQVELLHYTPLHVCSHAIRTCWNSHSKSDKGRIDENLIYRVGNINKHKSVLEHLFYNFDIKGISRACLQELARHRMASLSVKSTRYTLKELNKEDSFLPLCKDTYKRAEKYIMLSSNERVKDQSIKALENLRLAIKQGIANDIAKYIIPECYRTELVWSINARSLQNFLELRTAKVALKEIRELAYSVYKALPQGHLYLFSGFLTQNKEILV